MSLQTLIVYSPFLAVVYVLFGLLQALRKKHQGFFAALLAFLTIALTVAAYVTTTDPLTKAQLTQYMLINAGVVFIGSLLMLLLERRDSERDANRSYGMLGLGVSILMALGIFATPLLSGALAASQAGGAANNFGNGTLQNVRSFTPGAGGQTGAATTQAAPDGSDSQLAQVLTAQTGLSTDDLNTQVGNGSTIAQLVSAHNGDLNAVTTAMVNSLDQLTASGSQGAQLLSRLGSDNSSIANQIIQGQIPGRFSTRILTMLITGAAPSFGGGGNGSGGNGGGGFGGNGSGGNGTGGAAPQPTPEATTQAAAPAAQAAPSTNAQLVQVLTAQTGLSPGDLNTQITGGATIAQLVTAHNGDLNVVNTAIVSALDQLTAAGGRTAQLLSRLGSDNATIATQIVQGQLPAQVQQRVISVLVTSAAATTGGAPSTGGNGTDGNGTGGNGGGTGSGGSGFPPPTSAPNAAPDTNQSQAAPAATSLPPTATVARPTPISFPTDTPTPEAASTEQATAEAQANTTAAAACTLIPDYNLNLRDKPNKDTGSVLVSIPLGTNVTADQRTSDSWYHVSFGGHDGWVDGQFASPSAGCSTLPVATPSS